MPPMDTSAPYYPIALQLDPNFNWPSGNNCLEMYDVKSEAEGGLPAPPALNSAGESCMSKVFQGVYQRSGILPPPRRLSASEGLTPNLSDPPALGGLDNIQPVKCAYSTVTSAQRVDPFSNRRVPLMQQELSFGANDGWKSSVAMPTVARGDDRQKFSGGSYDSYRLVSRGQRPSPPLGAASAAMESESLSQNEIQCSRRNITVTRCASDGVSVDDVIPTSSTVSSASGSLAREQEEDDAMCTTSSEPSSQLGRTQSLGVTAGIESIVLSHHDEQQKQMSGLASAGGSSHSVDQRDIGSPGSNSRGALKDHDSSKKVDAPCLLAKDATESSHMTRAVDLKHKHDDLGMNVDGDSWRKELTSPAGSGVNFFEQSPNLVNVAPAPIGPTGSFFMRNNSSNIRHPHSDTLKQLNTSANKPAVALKETLMRDNNLANLAHAMMFNPSFAAVDMAAVESSRPKRRNVKISKDPQSVAARHRRERISDRIRILQRLVPGGTKMDTASMLDEAILYVKFLKAQVQTLENVSNAAGGFDPRLAQPFPGYRNSPLPYTPMPMDCATVSQGLSSAPDHGVYGAGPQIHSYSSYPDACREQFCH